MSLSLGRPFEEVPYWIQPSLRRAIFFDDHTILEEVREPAAWDSSPRPLARRTGQSSIDRCCLVLFIFTVYLLLSFCLAIGVLYTDNNRAYFFRWVPLRFTDLNEGRTVSTAPPTWEGLKGGEHCLRFATREYTAKLSTNAIGQGAMRVCKETPTEIHGRPLLTDFCQDLGRGRGVWGFWIVNFDETACQTTWGEFKDIGCVNNGLDIESSFRRIEAHLDNLQIGADWRIMCTTTPAEIYGRHFFTPTECFNLGKLGVFGAWDVQDPSCQSLELIVDSLHDSG